MPTQLLRNAFALALTNALIARYNQVPSAAFVAWEFNLRTIFSDSITQESARRWLKGLALPEFDKLLVLRSWLDLDLNLLGMPDIYLVEETDGQFKKEALVKQEDFSRETESIKQALQFLMSEVISLENKWGSKM